MSEGIEISIKADVKDAVYALKSLEKDSKKITKGVLNGVGNYTKAAIKKEFKTHLTKRSGNLYKSINKKINRRGDTVYIAPRARAENRVLYGWVVGNGTDIKAKNEKYLTFKIDGKWIRKKEVHIPPRDYMMGPALRYIDSPKYKDDLDKIMAKQTQKALKKRGIKV